MTEWLRAEVAAPVIGVDREQGEGVINGMVVATLGPFKSGRGEFDLKSLKSIVSLMKKEPQGLKMRLAHPDESNDGVGKLVARVKEPYLGTAMKRVGPGEYEEVPAVRGNAHILKSSRNTPNGDLGGYVMDVVEESPDAISSSLVLSIQEEYRLNKDGTPQVDDTGRPLPPLWRPVDLHASDFVDTGDAVDSLLGAKLSAEGMPHEVLNQARQLLSKQFAGKPRSFVEKRLSDWQSRVLDFMYPEEEQEDELSYGDADTLRRKLLLRKR